MKCIVPGSNLKVFGRAIHSLAKIGDEIYFEAKTDGLSIGTVNSSRCAYMNFSFKITFFQKFSFQDVTKNTGEDAEESIKCKVYTKSCLAVFKSLASLEKTADKCVIVLDMEEDRFIFQLHCRHGLMKTYNLTFIESEKLDAIFSVDDCPNSMIIQSRLFAEVVGNFQPNAEEMSLRLFGDKAVVANHILETEGSTNIMRTEVELLSQEFDEYNVTSPPAQVIFCLKEFRALLFFCEGLELQFSMFVRTPGEPIVFVVDSDPAFDSHLVLATVSSADRIDNSTAAAVDTTTSVSRKRVSRSTASSSKEKSERKTKKVLFDVSNSRDDGEQIEPNNESHFIADATLAHDTFVTDDGEDIGEENRVINTPQPSTSSSHHGRGGGGALRRSRDSGQTSLARNARQPTNRSGSEEDLPSLPTPRTKRKAESKDDGGSSLAEQLGGRSGGSANQSHSSNRQKPEAIFQLPIGEDNGDDNEDNDDRGVTSETLDQQTTRDESSMEDQNGDDDDVVPGTPPPEEPPSKRFRSLFFGLSQSQSQEDSVNQSAAESRPVEEDYAVLAEDSEDEG